jgi:Kef-type K+ transport system membrane component KefB
VLNIVNSCLDKLLYCGLIGQLFIGILWATPGAKWLDRDKETIIQQLGYLGLIMLVYEGGLSTLMASLRANVYVSLAVAFTGIAIRWDHLLSWLTLVSVTPLQAFSIGAALSSTSLGTTFTIPSTTQLVSTRLGTVTTCAAMLDDVIGLVMVQIISNLGGSGDSFRTVTVIRPLFVSIGFGVGVLDSRRGGTQSKMAPSRLLRRVLLSVRFLCCLSRRQEPAATGQRKAIYSHVSCCLLPLTLFGGLVVLYLSTSPSSISYTDLVTA